MKIREDAFQYYFYFMQERMNIFWQKYENTSTPFTEDKILVRHKFTNVYRATDRVSQYLIKNVIYSGDESLKEEDILLRILIFKIFNKIETWEYLEQEFGLLRVDNFDVDKISKRLSFLIKRKPIFNSAYMMTGTHRKYNHLHSKHEKWLNMVKKEMLEEGKFKQIIKAKSLEEIFLLLQSCSFLGDFLSYQYTIDFNYSTVIDFNENSFVKAGIGAVRGVKKCFEDLGKYSYEDAIRYTQDNLEKYQIQYGFEDFKNLFGREPTLIDLQNCFCETDKYLRVKMPHLHKGNKRIKQKYNQSKGHINLFFPPKWKINKKVKPWSQQNSEGLTLF